MHKLPANHAFIDRPAQASIKHHITTSIAATKKARRRSARLCHGGRSESRRFMVRQSFAVTLTPRTDGMVFGAPMAAPMIIGNGTGFSGSALIVRLFGASR